MPPHCRPTPRPPFEISLPLQSPPPPPGDRHFNNLLLNIFSGGLCCPSVTHGLALVSHHFKSITCMCSVILQSTLDAFSQPNPIVTDSTADNVQLTSSPSPPVEGTTLCLEIPLQSPPPLEDRHLATVPPPPPHRPALGWEIPRGGGGNLPT